MFDENIYELFLKDNIKTNKDNINKKENLNLEEELNKYNSLINDILKKDNYNNEDIKNLKEYKHKIELIIKILNSEKENYIKQNQKYEDDKFTNNYLSFLNNLKQYYLFKEKNIIPESFNYIYSIYNIMSNEQKLLNHNFNDDIDNFNLKEFKEKDNYNDLMNEYNYFIKLYNDNYKNNKNKIDLFNHFIIKN